MTPARSTDSIEVSVALDASERAAEQALLPQFAVLNRAIQARGRPAYDEFVARTPTADGVQFAAVDEAGIRGWWCHPQQAVPGRVLLFIHGGAYLLGSATAFRGFASQLASRANAATFVLEYPLAPEHALPVALDSAIHACDWLAGNGARQLVIAGDSAGGGLTLATTSARLHANAALRTLGCLVFSPWVDLAFAGATADFADPVLPRAALSDCARAYVGAADLRDPRASPLYDVPTGLPPLYIQVGSEELLLDDARRYAARAAAQGCQVRLEVWEGLHHDFQFELAALPSARAALDRAGAFLRECFEARSPTV